MVSGFIAIVGAPNVGKSTFLNRVLEFKLAITSQKPQTTRHRILGVYTREDLQAIFLDTPGMHSHPKALNKRMMETALNALHEVDAALFMVEASARGLAQGAKLAPILMKAGLPVVLALNKVDQVKDKAALLPYLEEAARWGELTALVPLSALKGLGCGEVVDELKSLLPQGGPLFPPNTITDLSERFLVAELIREKVFRLTGQEVPYAVAVTIDEFLDPEAPGRLAAIAATIHVERKGQKAIVIGNGGAMIKMIGSAARRDIERLLGIKIYLNLFVRVERDWTKHQRGLTKLGY